MVGHTLILSLSVVTVVACGHGHDDSSCGLEANCTAAQVNYVDGLVVAGDAGKLNLRVITAVPNPPDPTVMNTWTVEIVDSSNTRVSGATVTKMNTWSVDCGHFGVEGAGGADLSNIDNGDGTFTFAFHYGHGGPWNFELDVAAGADTDHTVVGLCLPETGDHTHE